MTCSLRKYSEVAQGLVVVRSKKVAEKLLIDSNVLKGMATKNNQEG